MKKLPFVQRWRETPVDVPEPTDSGRPFRLWMTGSLAVVMAAMIPIREVPDSERHNGMRLLRHSRFGVNETVKRIEAAARDRGFSVLVLVPGTKPVLVLESSVGGTPVVMDAPDSAPAMPFSVMVREAGSGGAEVLIASLPDADAALGWQDLPSAVVDDLAALPDLVDHALT